VCNGELSQGSLMYVSLSQSELEVELPLSESSIMIASSVVWVCSGSTGFRGHRSLRVEEEVDTLSRFTGLGMAMICPGPVHRKRRRERASGSLCIRPLALGRSR
jgi:hypothetical protein